MRCPVCSGELEERDVAPCYDCGHASSELGELSRGEHDYHVFTIFGQEIVLCDFCDADFGSYMPEYLGLPSGSPMDYPLELVRKVIAPRSSRDGYCVECQHRLAFQLFLKAVREYNSA